MIPKIVERGKHSVRNRISWREFYCVGSLSPRYSNSTDGVGAWRGGVPIGQKQAKYVRSSENK